MTVVRYEGRRGAEHYWDCICDCGNSFSPSGRNLKAKRSMSCGCATADATRSRSTTHGLSGSPEHRIWNQMKQRCSNPSRSSYHLYGGRGVSVCTEWADSFTKFLEDMGPRPSRHHSIDRIDSDGDYCAENCRWVTAETQNRNKRSNIKITIGGRTQTAAEWAREMGISKYTIYHRIRRGWSKEAAVMKPIRHKSAARGQK